MRKNLLLAGAGFFVTLLIIVAGFIAYSILTSQPEETTSVQPDTVIQDKTPAPPSAEAKKEDAGKSPNPVPPAAPASKAVPTPAPKAAPKTAPAAASFDKSKQAAAITPPKPFRPPALDKGKIDDAKEYASIAGSVFDEQGIPVAGAEVITAATGFDSETDTGFDLPFADKDHVYTASANDQGRYEIKGVRYAGIVVLRAATGAYAGGAQARVKRGDDLKNVDITVSPAVSLTGRILDVGGPSAGVIVNAAAFLPGSGRFVEGIVAGNLAKTDEKGEFRLAFRDRGIAALQVTTAQGYQALFQNVAVGNPDLIELRLLRPATLQGHVTTGAGQAPQGTTVVLTRKWAQFADPAVEDLAGPHLEGAGPVYTGDVGTDGAYMISAVDPGASFDAYVRSQAKPLTERQSIGPLLPGETKVWDTAIEDEVVFRGFVLGANTQQPLASAYVHCRKKEQDEPSRSREDAAPLARANADGSFEIRAGGGSGVYVLSPRYSAGGPDLTARPWIKEMNCQAGGVYDVDLSLPEPCVLPVRVLDESGLPVRGAQIDIATVMPDRVAMSLQAGVTDEQGRFARAGLVPGLETWLEISKPGSPRVRTRSHLGGPGEIFPEEPVAMVATSGIEGFAVAPDGTPLPRVGIMILPQAQTASSQPLYTSTDDIGHFILRAGIPGPSASLKLVLQTSEQPAPAASVGPLQAMAGQVVNLGQVTFVPQ